MGFLDLFKVKPQPRPTGKPDFKAVLMASLQITEAFGELLEKKELGEGGGIYYSEKRLPFPKVSIEQAIDLIQRVVAEDRLRTEVIKCVSPQEAQYILSSKYLEAMKACRVYLDYYLPEDDPRLAEQRATMSEMRGFLDQMAKNGMEIPKIVQDMYGAGGPKA